VSAGLILLIVLLNIIRNDYGLFGNIKGESVKVYYNERTSKYLLSFNYIPANFDGILIGPSLSNNLDTSKIDNYRIYNASINGGNVSEVKYIVDNVMERGHLKVIVICLHPYFTKDHGRKSSYIDPQEYWAALGSMQLVKLYIYRAMIKFGLAGDYFNDYGYNDFIKRKKGINVKQVILNHAQKMVKDEEIQIDEVAYRELGEIIKKAERKGLRIVGFYYPEPYEIYKKMEKSFEKYKRRINSLFGETSVVIDFDSEKYLDFRTDYTNYSDRGHLSYKGADFVLAEIKKVLNASTD
jgi:hypothetical protein